MTFLSVTLKLLLLPVVSSGALNSTHYPLLLLLSAILIFGWKRCRALSLEGTCSGFIGNAISALEQYPYP